MIEPIPPDAVALIRGTAWQGGELPLTELAALWRTDGGYALHGTVVGALRGIALAARYAVECTQTWETRRVRVELTTPPHVREIVIDVDENVRWHFGGREVPELAGIRDIDIQITPATNTLPIRRLALAVGDEAEVTAAWLQFPALELSPLEQSYRRLDERRYEYRSRDFRAELLVNEDGLVESYGSFWRRLTPAR